MGNNFSGRLILVWCSTESGAESKQTQHQSSKAPRNTMHRDEVMLFAFVFSKMFHFCYLFYPLTGQFIPRCSHHGNTCHPSSCFYVFSHHQKDFVSGFRLWRLSPAADITILNNLTLWCCGGGLGLFNVCRLNWVLFSVNVFQRPVMFGKAFTECSIWNILCLIKLQYKNVQWFSKHSSYPASCFFVTVMSGTTFSFMLSH